MADIGKEWRKGCPDCAALPDRNQVRHTPDCPIMVGVERAVADDRDWFAKHPSHKKMTRRITWAERVEIETTIGRKLPGETVTVERHGDDPAGPRSRFVATHPDGGTDLMILDDLPAPGGEAS